MRIEQIRENVHNSVENLWSGARNMTGRGAGLRPAGPRSLRHRAWPEQEVCPTLLLKVKIAAPKRYCDQPAPQREIKWQR